MSITSYLREIKIMETNSKVNFTGSDMIAAAYIGFLGGVISISLLQKAALAAQKKRMLAEASSKAE